MSEMDPEDSGSAPAVTSEPDPAAWSSKGMEGSAKETVTDEEAAVPPDLEWLEELDEASDSDDDLAAAADTVEKRTYAETARMFKLRRNLDQLDHFRRQKERDLLRAREKLNLLCQNIDYLLAQRNSLEKEIEQQKAEENSVTVFRLRTQHKNLCQELQREEEMEAQIKIELRQQELELNEVEVELGRFTTLCQDLQEEEQVFQVYKTQQAAARLEKEKKAYQNHHFKMQHLRDKKKAMLKTEETEHQQKVEACEASHKKTEKYFRDTIRRMNQEEAEREQQNKELQEKRMHAVMSLKANIAATQESLQLQQRRVKANAQKKEKAQSIKTRKMYQQKQQEQIKKHKEQFEARRRSKREEIMNKLLEEEQRVERRKRQQALLPQPPTTDKSLSPQRITERLLHCLETNMPSTPEPKATVIRAEFSSSSSASSDQEDLEEPIQQKVDLQSFADSLAEPEFSGLWDHNYKKPSDEKTVLRHAEQKQDEAMLTSGKLNVATKKVCGKEWKGAPFISKPEVILFKDFEVGETYKKKVIITNVSYITNHCKLLGVSTQLKDFISVKFDPPGSLSTGMSCDMQAIFQPMINEDLEGEVQFASAAGPFSVPVKCTIKKCDLAVDSQFIDFGSHIVGQTVSWTITLTNRGALATLFSLETSTLNSPETHHVQMPSEVSPSTCQETSTLNATSEVQRSSASTGTKEVKQHGQEEEHTMRPNKESSDADPGSVFEACVPHNVHVQTDASLSDSCDISLGNVRDGEIGPFESVKLEIVFSPTIPGEAELDFHIKFSDLTSNPIPIKARGVAVTLPVRVVQPNIDLKICMFDYLYQDIIVVQSRASTALKLTFEVCREMRKHLEILPKTGFIQAHSSFNAHLKFLPRHSLSKDAPHFFDSYTGVLEVPLKVQVADQVQPVGFTVQAVVTSSDLKFDRTEVDFGYCSIYQSIKTSVRLTNLSLLAQEFGFVGIPGFIDVQPNDGFGTLLPQETLEIDLIFSADKAKEYNFQINCTSAISRVFPLACRAVGVRPPMELSHTLVQFGATAVGDDSTALIYLINPYTGRKQANQFVTRGPEEAVIPLQPRLFSFIPPQDADIKITPSAGRLLPGERCLVQVMFRPTLAEQDIKNEALRQAKMLHEKEIERKPAEQEPPVDTSKGRKGSARSIRVVESPRPFSRLEAHPIDTEPGSELYEVAQTQLLKLFTWRYSEYTIPCFVSDGDPPEEDRQAQPSWSPLNTLYLRLQCRAVQPPLVVVSKNTNNIIDFQQVAVGERVIKTLTVENITKESLELKTSVLDLFGPFSLLNCLKSVKAGQRRTLILAFSPTLEKKHCEVLEVNCKHMSIEVTLHGEGVVPAVTSSHLGGILDFDYVLEKDSASQVVNLQNSSTVAVGFKVQLYSLSPSRPQGGLDKLSLLLGSDTDSQNQPAVGTQNNSGMSVFSVVPGGGSIAPGQSQDVTVTFQPDHASEHYFDRLTIELANKSKVCDIELRGAASSHNMFLEGGDKLTVPIESLLPPLVTSHPQVKDSVVTEKSSIPVLVTMQASYSNGAIRPAVRELQVGCIQSSQPSKKGGEFLWDNVAALQQLGFNVDPIKSSVAVGQRRTITLTWTPQRGYNPFEVVEKSVPLTLKGDVTSVYRVTLIAFVSNSGDNMERSQ